MSTFERTARAARATEHFGQVLHARTVQRVSELDGLDAATRLDKFRQRREYEQLMAKEENDLVKLAEAIEEVLHVGSTHVHSILVDNTCSLRVFNEFAGRPELARYVFFNVKCAGCSRIITNIQKGDSWTCHRCLRAAYQLQQEQRRLDSYDN